MRRFLHLIPLFVCLFGVSKAQQTATAPAIPQEYAGNEMCAVCHEDLGLAFPQDPHRQIAKFRGGKWAGQECEACHGPGAQHSESADTTLILGFSNLAPDRINQSCLECHIGEETQRGRLSDSHYRNSVACTSCHSVHHSKRRDLLTADSTALCSPCHISERAAFNRPFTHRLVQKAIDCVDCHNPHGGAPPSSLQQFAANDTGCLKCHTDKRGPFPFEHAPIKLEPCSECHEPHGSANPRMLVRRDVSQLCLECHTLTPQNLGGPPTAFHDLRSARFRNCTICHSKIHGSFVSKDFLR